MDISFVSGSSTLPRNNSCLSCLCCSCHARRATCLVAARGAALATCAALFRRPSTPFLASAFLLPLPFWREHCAESERGRHAEPRAFYGTQSRRVRASRDSCGFLSVFRLLGAEQFIVANHNPAEHCLCFACQDELPKQSNIIRRTHTHDQCKTYLIFMAIRML